ncbi:hypothetical protein Tco_0605664 [Tanacetum coccineum]
MSSSPHSTITSSEFDMENAFSTMNIHNYTSASSATSRSTSFNSSEDSRDAFYAKESPISPPAPIISPAMLPPSPIFNPQEFFVPEKLLPPKKQTHLPSLSSTDLSNPSRKQAYSLEPPSFSVYTPAPPQIFEIGKSSIKMHLKHHEKQIEDILNYLEELSFHCIEKMEEKLVNGRMIIQKDFDELKTALTKIRSQISKLQKKHIGQKDKIAFVRDTMPLKRTSTSEAPAMTQDAIRQLVADSVAAALEAQAAADNININTGLRKTHVARKCTYKKFMSDHLLLGWNLVWEMMNSCSGVNFEVWRMAGKVPESYILYCKFSP